MAEEPTKQKLHLLHVCRVVLSRLLLLPTPLRPNGLMAEYRVSASLSPFAVYTYSAMISKEKKKKKNGMSHQRQTCLRRKVHPRGRKRRRRKRRPQHQKSVKEVRDKLKVEGREEKKQRQRRRGKQEKEVKQHPRLHHLYPLH